VGSLEKISLITSNRRYAYWESKFPTHISRDKTEVCPIKVNVWNGATSDFVDLETAFISQYLFEYLSLCNTGIMKR